MPLFLDAHTLVLRFWVQEVGGWGRTVVKCCGSIGIISVKPIQFTCCAILKALYLFLHEPRLCCWPGTFIIPCFHALFSFESRMQFGFYTFCIHFISGCRIYVSQSLHFSFPHRTPTRQSWLLLFFFFFLLLRLIVFWSPSAAAKVPSTRYSVDS